MKKILKTIITCSCILLLAGKLNAQGIKITINSPIGNVSSRAKGVIHDEIKTAIIKSGKYILADTKTDADYILESQVNDQNGNFEIISKLTNIKTINVYESSGVTKENYTDLGDVIKTVVDDLLKNIPQQKTQNTYLWQEKPIPQRSKEEKLKQTPQNEYPKETKTPQSNYGGNLSYSGSKVLKSGQKLSYYEVQQIMKGADALYTYEKGIKLKRWGDISMWSGIGLSVAGTVLYEFTDADKEDIGSLMITVGCGSIIGGVITKIIGRYKIQKSVNMYNSQRLQIGITNNGGIGLAYNF